MIQYDDNKNIVYNNMVNNNMMMMKKSVHFKFKKFVN